MDRGTSGRQRKYNACVWLSVLLCIALWGGWGEREETESRWRGAAEYERLYLGSRKAALAAEDLPRVLHATDEVKSVMHVPTLTQTHNIPSNIPHRIPKQAHRITNSCVRSAGVLRVLELGVHGEGAALLQTRIECRASSSATPRPAAARPIPRRGSISVAARQVAKRA